MFLLNRGKGVKRVLWCSLGDDLPVLVEAESFLVQKCYNKDWYRLIDVAPFLSGKFVSSWRDYVQSMVAGDKKKIALQSLTYLDQTVFEDTKRSKRSIDVVEKLYDVSWNKKGQLVGSIQWKDTEHNYQVSSWQHMKKVKLTEFCETFPEALSSDMLIRSIPSNRINYKETEHSYNADEISQRSTKQKANNFFSNAIEIHCAQKSIGLVVYLDAQDGHTTRTLADKTHHQRVVVNFDPQVLQTLLSLSCSHKTLMYPGSLYNYFVSANERSMVAVWFDYCGTFGGNSTCKPQEDITLMFNRKLLRSGSIVAFTFCRRAQNSDSENIIDWIISTGIQNYPNITLLDYFTYYPCMLFILCKV